MRDIGALWADGHPRLTPAGGLGARPRCTTTDEAPGRFRTRPVDVLAMRHDGSWDRAEAVTAWVAAAGEGDTTSLDVVDGRPVVLIMQPGQTDVLWLTPGQHLVLSRRQLPRWRVYGAAEFRSCFAPAVRELPIFDDRDVAE